MSDRLEHYIAEMRASIARSESAEDTYRRRVEEHVTTGRAVGRKRVDSEVRASSDAIVRGAVADGAFYRDRAKTYALAILAEHALEGR